MIIKSLFGYEANLNLSNWGDIKGSGEEEKTGESKCLEDGQRIGTRIHSTPHAIDTTRPTRHILFHFPAKASRMKRIKRFIRLSIFAPLISLHAKLDHCMARWSI